MRTVYLESFRDDETGELGLGIADVARHEQMNAATDALLIAHDLLEHVNGAAHIGSISDELEALGGIWYVRGQHGELRRDGMGSAHSIESNLAADVVRMFHDAVYGLSVDYSAKLTRPSDIEETIDEILVIAEREWPSEFDAHREAAELRRARDLWPRFASEVRARMRTGWRKCRAKWNARGRYAANNQFWAIVEAVQPYCQPDTEGMRFKLTYGDGRAYCEEDYGEDY